MDLSALQIVAIVIAALMTVAGSALLVRAVLEITKTARMGQPDGTRTNDPGARTVTLVREFLGHTRMARRPFVALAHWLTMVSFGGLFLMLVASYGQLFDPEFALPLLGHWPPYLWVVETLIYAGWIGITGLIINRQIHSPRREGNRSRFQGSTAWQAYFVEGIIFGVLTCHILQRSLEYVVDEEGRGTAHYPLSQFLGSAFEGLSHATAENLIVVVALVDIIISMTWAVTIGLNATMGVAWHRFLAFPNIWLKRNATGRTSLGPLQPISIKGEVLDFENVEELDEDAALGVGVVENFTWKGLLDFSTCTECGRCQSQCPAWNTDKPLSPKMLILSLRDHANAKAPWVLASESTREAAGKAGDDAAALSATGIPATALAERERPLIGPTGYEDVDILQWTTAAYGGGASGEGGVIDPDVLWSCVTCGACVEQCPVDIEHVDHIVDMRRYQVLIESAFPNELNGLFKNLEKNANPWGMSPRLRLDWTKNLDFEVKQVGVDVEDLSEVEYLFWVGCAGAFEDRQKKTTQAVAELLNTAGVTFAVLGDGEACTGDSARRAGNEFLFQQLAMQNVETLNEMKATKVVVTCAHCFNTLSNEYPQLGGNYEVVHHTQLLNRLVRDGKLTPVAPVGRAAGETVAAGPAPTTDNPDTGAGQDVSTEPASSSPGPDTHSDSGIVTGEETTEPEKPAPAPVAAAKGAGTVTYHDPCYIGRHNGIYEPPRELIGSLPGVEFREMPRNQEKSFCCGAGGARMWMEEKIGQRINLTRTQEAVETGADTIAVGCPFCRTMLSDGLTAKQADGEAREEVQVLDVAQLLLAAVKRGS